MNNQTSSSDHEHYLSMAATYDYRINAILPMSELFFSSCLSFIPGGPTRVLELGSGTGYATVKIRNLNPGAAITCIDHSPEMIRYASQKPELRSIRILKQDIRDPWPEREYDLVMTTLCLHHIPEKDRPMLLRRVFEALPPAGIFICGDIIRPESLETEEIYLDRWIRSMKDAGLDMDEASRMIQSRKENYPEMETIPGFYKKLKDAGFTRVLMPYKREISAVFIGYR